MSSSIPRQTRRGAILWIALISIAFTGCSESDSAALVSSDSMRAKNRSENDSDGDGVSARFGHDDSLESYSIQDGPRSLIVNRSNDTIEVRYADENGAREIIVDRADEQPEDGLRRVYVVRSLTPSVPADAENLRWFFRAVGPHVVLRTSEGSSIEHPDRGVMQELIQRFDEQQSAAPDVIRDLRRLVSMDSRLTVYSHMAQAKELAPEAMDALVNAVIRGLESALLAIDSEGVEPADGLPTLVRAICTLAQRDDLEVARADRLARHSEKIRLDYYEVQVLRSLLGKASHDMLLWAAGHIADGQIRQSYFLDVARQSGMGRPEWDAIVAATPPINSDHYESQLLVELAEKASIPALLDATKHVGDAQLHHNVLMAIAKREDLDEQSAAQLAQATPQIDFDYYESQVLMELAPRAPTSALLEAAAEIQDSQQHHHVLLAAIESVATPADADLIAAACPQLQLDYFEAQVIKELIGKANLPAILEATQSIEDSIQEYEIFSRLLLQEPLSQADADLIAAGAEQIDFAAHRTEILLKLVDEASPDVLREAARTISSDADRLRLLDALNR